MRTILVTSCTNRKKRLAAPFLRARTLTVADISSVAFEWVGRLRGATDMGPARELYAGRAFDESIKAAASGADLYVLSAGLGLVSAGASVPSYSLTVVGKDPDNVLLRIAGDGENRTPSRWWAALTNQLGTAAPLAELVSRSSESVIVLALPKTYLQLVTTDLAALSDAELSRLRIVGVKSSIEGLPARIAASAVVYDERFESAGSGFAGTKSDFAQRVARHFLNDVLSKSPSGSCREHSDIVAEFLAHHLAPVTQHRPRYSDDELKDVIRDLWAEVGGRVTVGLRVLRRGRQIACEQGRFKKLFAEISEEKRNANS